MVSGDGSGGSMRLELVARSGKRMGDITVDKEDTVDAFKQKFHEQYKYYPDRQRWTYGEKKAVLTEGTMGSFFRDGDRLIFKDLGVQVSWRLVFFLEYLGPLLIFPIFFYLPEYVYGGVANQAYSLEQKLSFYVFMGHFAKRELESLFVHRFSNATMPWTSLVRNCFHYWILAAVLIGYPLFHPKYTPLCTHCNPDSIVPYVLTGIICFTELMNLGAHCELRRIRPRNTKTYGQPKGWGYQFVTCANYFWESLSWITFLLLCGCASGLVFVIYAIQIMATWAKAKHKRMCRQFPEYPKNKAAIFPYIY